MALGCTDPRSQVPGFQPVQGKPQRCHHALSSGGLYLGSKMAKLQVVVLLCTERRKEYIPSFQPSKICKTSLACLVSSIKIDVRLLLTQDHGDHGNVFLHLASSTILHLAPWSCTVLSIQQWPNNRMLRPSNDEVIHHTGLMAWTLASQPAQIVWYLWVYCTLHIITWVLNQFCNRKTSF